MPTKPKTNNKAVVQFKTSEEIKDLLIRSSRAKVDPDVVLQEVEKELFSKGSGYASVTPSSNLFKGMTLLEFELGTLLTTIILEQYKTFGIDMMRRLQIEYNCVLTSEKATAELARTNLD